MFNTLIKKKNIMLRKTAGMAISALALIPFTAFVFAKTATTSPTVISSNPSARHQPVVVQIGPEGRTLLRGTVDSLGTDSIVVKSWGGKWTVRVGANTQILPKITGGVSDLSGFKAGDFVGVQGKTADSPDWTIDATLVRNWTERQAVKETRKEVLQTEKKGRIEGVGKNFEGTTGTVSADSFTITLQDGKVYTVKVSADAKVVNRNFLKMNLSDIRPGDRVRFFGTIDTTALTGNASVVRDVSVPR